MGEARVSTLICRWMPGPSEPRMPRPSSERTIRKHKVQTGVILTESGSGHLMSGNGKQGGSHGRDGNGHTDE